jgi:two-component system sensor histidine kinase PilS (NtrC family)
MSRERTGSSRRRAAPSADESWFGVFGGVEDTQMPDEAGARPPESRLHGSWDAAEEAAGRPSTLARAARRSAVAPQPAFDRIYRNFVAARAALAAALIATLGLVLMFGLRPPAETVGVSVAYAVLAIGLWLLPRLRPALGTPIRRLDRIHWIATIGIDLVCFSALHLMAPAAGLNYVALLVLPLLMAGVLTPRAAALATAAGVSILLLVAAWLNVTRGAEATALLTQAGLAGIGFFALTVLAGELAGRIAREELSARGSLEIARQQARLNQLVIEEMQDGVLVVDRRGRVRAANPAARRLLAAHGMVDPAPFQLRGVPEWRSLVDTVERAFGDTAWPEEGRDVVLPFPRGESRTLHVRLRFTRKRKEQEGEEFCVLFVDDVRNMQARTRQEKLAAMGRVSAGIAHEIRNPLAAIAQANALLAEDSTDLAQKRLTTMVADNVERLKRIVEDVMAVAIPGGGPPSDVIDATALVGTACVEWATSAGVPIGPDSPLVVELPEQPIGVAFDPEHLRRVLVNLLENALRHSSRQPGAVQVRLDSRDAQRCFLGVASDGEPIPGEVEAHLFEPFFSTRSRGTGLGLYICRELCERHGASIDYRRRDAGEPRRNEFYIAMLRRALPSLVQPRLESTP